MTLTRNTTNGMSKMTNKYIVEIQVTGTEIYEIESDVSLTEHELKISLIIGKQMVIHLTAFL